MSNVLVRFVLLAFVLISPASAAEPIKLKLSFFSSDRSTTYLSSVKPFVDAVNGEAKGLIEIEVYFSGALGKLQAQQPYLVDDGVADIALVVVGQAPARFEDSAVIELPGLFHNATEATLTYSRLVAAGALSGFESFFVIGAYTADPNSIHTRQSVATLADLKSLKIRTNNMIEASALERLGVVPVVLPLPQTLDAISRGAIDGATMPPSVLVDFGVARVVNHHYLLHTSAAPLALVMSRKKFDDLPEQARAVIRKYSGEWFVAHYLERWELLERQEIERLKLDPRRKVILPSESDFDIAQVAFGSVIDDWAATSAHNRDLLKLVRAELVKIRSRQ